MNIKLIIDQRETKIKEYFKNNNCIENIEYTNLDIGDFIYKNGEKLEYLIERKTIHDILQSITDGRYKEQKMRMLDQLPQNRILYIIENISHIQDLEEKKQNMLYGFIINSMIRDNLHIMCTINVDHTIEILKRIYTKINNNYNDLFTIQDTLKDNYVSTLKIKKKENMNPNRCFLIQLCQIPGISHILASAIVEEYPSFVLLYKKYVETSNTDFLENIIIQKSKNKRKLGKKAASKIIEFLQFN